jgi:hypothetical protein
MVLDKGSTARASDPSVGREREALAGSLLRKRSCLI